MVRSWPFYGGASMYTRIIHLEMVSDCVSWSLQSTTRLLTGSWVGDRIPAVVCLFLSLLELMSAVSETISFYSDECQCQHTLLIELCIDRSSWAIVRFDFWFSFLNPLTREEWYRHFYHYSNQMKNKIFPQTKALNILIKSPSSDSTQPTTSNPNLEYTKLGDESFMQLPNAAAVNVSRRSQSQFQFQHCCWFSYLLPVLPFFLHILRYLRWSPAVLSLFLVEKGRRCWSGSLGS